jgi:putative CocE/NonD family hydrolase
VARAYNPPVFDGAVRSGSGVRYRSNVPVVMRDGVHLSTDLYAPDGDGPFPTVLVRTPYDNSIPQHVARARHLADAGYVVAIQDVRGRFDSEGVYVPFRNEGPDGFDTQEWIGHQPWSNGRIGMVGGSYEGWTQWTTMPLGSRFLTATVPSVMATSLHRGLVYRGGALNLGVLLTWGLRTSGHTRQRVDDLDWTEAFRTLPLSRTAMAAAQDIPHWRDWLAHEADDDWWAPFHLDAHWEDVSVPALLTGGWYDLYSSDTFTSYAGLRARGRGRARQSRLLVGAWPHALSSSTTTGGVDFGARSMVDLEGLEGRWLDRWLRDVRNGVDEEPPVRIFVMGENQWRDASGWPLPETDYQPWYLHSGGSASTLLGDGTLSPAAPRDESADTFTYDPDYPVQTRGGCNCCQPDLIPWGPYDQRDVEMRSDVLVYTSAPLERDLTVIGPVRVVLWAATDGPDTDWTAKLVDVRPSGFAMNLCDGIVRARWRRALVADASEADRRTPRPLTPGSLERYEIDLMVTGNTFLAGHRVRVEISSSNFPRFDRNPNTGAPLGAGDTVRRAHQTVVHDAVHPSHIVLPVIPG